MSDDYANHLARLHAGFEAPAELIAAAAREVSASPIAARQRIVHGEANEVWRLTFESGLGVILRIARRAEGVFEKEAWALGLCRGLRMAVPEVLSLQRLETQEEPLELCFLELLPGERLSDSLSLPRETLRAIVRELGEQISRMHAIAPDDLGPAARYFADDTDDFLAMEPEFLRLGSEAGLNPAALARAFRFYETAMARPEPLTRRLTHNDFRACHILTHEGRLSGVIDFGQVSMDSPINEFAKWDYWEAPDLPIAWLREGYGDQTLFDEAFDARLAALRIANALWVLRWYSLTAYGAGVERAAAAVGRYVSELGLG
jgi:aminoglycoside phosphotransferase (APT) family kinase protein